jgi:hypothetical protein
MCQRYHRVHPGLKLKIARMQRENCPTIGRSLKFRVFTFLDPTGARNVQSPDAKSWNIENCKANTRRPALQTVARSAHAAAYAATTPNRAPPPAPLSPGAFRGPVEQARQRFNQLVVSRRPEYPANPPNQPLRANHRLPRVAAAPSACPTWRSRWVPSATFGGSPAW